MKGLGRTVLDVIWRPWYRGSALGKLAERYPGPEAPPESYRKRQTVQLGGVRWRNIAKLAWTDQGFYLQIGTAPSALVPWQDIQDRGASLLFMLPAHTLALGLPNVVELRVYNKVYQELAPYLI